MRCARFPRYGIARFGYLIVLLTLGLPLGGLIDSTAPAVQEIETGEDAVILEERMEIDILSISSATVRYFNRTKILTPRGAERYQVAPVYYRPGVKIADIRGSITLPSGKRVEIRKPNLAEGAAFASYELYSDTRYRSVLFPGAVPQSIVEHSYEQAIENLLYLPHEFHLQEAIPVHLKTLSVRVASQLPVRLVARGGSPEHTREEGDGFVTHRWTARDVPALRREDSMPPAEDLFPRVLIAPAEILWGERRIDAKTWDGVARFYWELARERMDPSPEVTRVAKELAGDAPTPNERIRRLYEFTQRKINYVAVSLGIGGWQPHPNGDVLRLQYGDCKDKATLLISMLRAIGADGFPVLIRTRDHGLLDRDVPFFAFNHAIVALPREDGYLFLDPTSEHTPFPDLPWRDQGVPVLVVREDGRGELTETPLFPPERNRRHLSITGTIGASGALDGTCLIDSWGQQREHLAPLQSSKPTEREDTLEELLSWLAPGAQMRSHELPTSTESDGPLRVVLHFAIPGFVRRGGALEIISPHVARFPDLTSLSAYPRRTHPILLPYLFVDSVEARLRLPQGRTLRKIPEGRKVGGPGLATETRYEIVREEDRNVLVVNRSVSTLRRDIPVADYPALRALLLSLTEEESIAVSLQPE